MTRIAYDIATQELGVAEIYGDVHNKRILEYHQATRLKATTDEVAWCASFVNWCLWQGHVAFFTDIDGESVVLLGGNQNNRVSLASFPKHRIISIRRVL
jgi:hypothetical protein